MTDHIDQYPDLEKSNYYTNMELIYFRISDKEKKEYYSYVPVWRLAVKTNKVMDDKIYIERPIYVNAIDGSVIYPQDEF